MYIIFSVEYTHSGARLSEHPCGSFGQGIVCHYRTLAEIHTGNGKSKGKKIQKVVEPKRIVGCVWMSKEEVPDINHEACCRVAFASAPFLRRAPLLPLD